MWHIWVRRVGCIGSSWGNRRERDHWGRLRHIWVDNIRMDLQEVGCGYMDWIGLAQDRDSWRTFVSAVMNFWVPWNAGNFLTSCKPVSFSRRTLHRWVSKYAVQILTHKFIQGCIQYMWNTNHLFSIYSCISILFNSVFFFLKFISEGTSVLWIGTGQSYC